MMTKSLFLIIKRNNFMITREILILNALKLKHGSSHGDMVDQIFAQDPSSADKLTKNVCARIPLELAEEMEEIGGILGLNKREMITHALRDFLDQANAVMEEFDVWTAIAPRGEEA
jgi:hypothetical protein